MELGLTKVHGSENDFFIIDETLLERKLTKEEINRLSETLCDRESGPIGGADGLLLVESTDSYESIAKMRVINSDGSEASMCGNGLRTVARYIAEKENKKEFLVETMHADLKVRQSSDFAKDVPSFQVQISPVSFQLSSVPANFSGVETLIDQSIPFLSDELHFSIVAVPNPHIIAFVDHETLISNELVRIAELVNANKEIFPDSANISFVEILEKNHLFVRTFERGVGLTNACGTAMCASSLMYDLIKDGEFFELITVQNPGGMVKTVVHQDPDGAYWMELIGNATFTATLSDSLENLIAGDFSNSDITQTNEQESYQAFISQLQQA